MIEKRWAELGLTNLWNNGYNSERGVKLEIRMNIWKEGMEKIVKEIKTRKFFINYQRMGELPNTLPQKLSFLTSVESQTTFNAFLKNKLYMLNMMVELLPRFVTLGFQIETSAKRRQEVVKKIKIKIVAPTPYYKNSIYRSVLQYLGDTNYQKEKLTNCIKKQSQAGTTLLMAGLGSRFDFNLAPAPAPESLVCKSKAPAPAPELYF